MQDETITHKLITLRLPKLTLPIVTILKGHITKHADSEGVTDQGGREVGSEEGMDEVREKVEYRDTGIPKKDARFFKNQIFFLFTMIRKVK